MTAPYLRRGVEGRSTHVCQIAARQLNRVRILATCKPEIPDLRSARGSLTALRRDQHVCRLEIAVHQPAIVQLLHAPEHAQEEGSVFFGIQVVPQVPAARRLHHNVVCRRGGRGALVSREVLDDIGVAQGCLHHVYLIGDHLCVLCGQLLHSNHVAVALQGSNEHLSEGTTPNFPGLAHLTSPCSGPRIRLLELGGGVQQGGGPLLVRVHGRDEGLQVAAARGQQSQMSWGAIVLLVQEVVLGNSRRP
mmetsp:Transcript_79043/g.246141  ORF Transcript_79043/g.246141 Transcript_79043/m.246141 type:complete len:248 (-) Transcript_79043:200-943(-)